MASLADDVVMSSSSSAPAPSSSTDVLDSIIAEEYKIWKKNTPFLYDLALVHALEWPSLTVQWLPTKNLTDTLSVQKLLIGTHSAPGTQDHLIIASVCLPRDDAMPESHARTYKAGEVGGYGGVSGKIKKECIIQHPGGEVNSARYMPQDDLILASKGPNAEVYVFDVRQHPSTPDPDAPKGPQVTCSGHSAEGYGLAWSPHVKGQLLSGSYDKLVCMWDVAMSSATCEPTHVYKGHDAVVEDVSWHAHHGYMFASVGDDRKMNIWDTRTKAASRTVADAHADEINSIDFNPFNEFLLATGGKDRVCKLWDLRNLDQELYHFGGEKHSVDVVGVQWSPHCETVLASWGFDRRVHVWDLARVNMKLSEEDKKDGPPELLFIHGGHTANVSDLCWNPSDEWIVATVAEDNILQIWQMAENIHSDNGIAVDSGVEP